MARPRKRMKIHPTSANASDDAGGSRKRTLVISLLALGAGAVTIGNFTGSGSSSSDTRTYRSIGQCEADRLLTAAECATQFQQAKQAHERAAPAFANRADCEKEFGANNCAQPTTNPARQTSYLPIMAAYLIGRRAAGGYQAAPMFRRPGDPAGEYRISAAFPAPVSTSSGPSQSSRSFSSGSRVYTSGSRTSTSRSGLSTSRTSTSRGGFGASSRSGGS